MRRSRFQPSKREQKKRQLELEKRKELDFINFIEDIGNISSSNQFLEIYKTTSFFKDSLTFETNMIHIFQGSNGQGKSTLLKDIANATMYDSFDSINNRRKIASNNKLIGAAFNNESLSPFNIEENSIFYKEVDLNTANVKNNLTIYTDFSIDFFRKEGHDTLHSCVQEYNKHSHGERKISGINDILSLIKTISKVEIRKGLDIIIIMDEPESGLSLDIQREFFKKLRRYINIFKKKDHVSLTFIIASHSLIWKDESIIKVHDISTFKKNEEKKKHKSVFI